MDELLPLVRLGSEMSTIRAREFYKNNLKSPLDIVNAGVNLITSILMSTIPFDESNPTGTDNDSKNQRLTFVLESNQRLAMKIIEKSKIWIQTELALMNKV